MKIFGKKNHPYFARKFSKKNGRARVSSMACMGFSSVRAAFQAQCAELA